MAKDRIAEATARDPIALKLGVYYANTQDSSQDHIAYAEQIQEFIAEVDHALDIMNSVNTQLSNPDVLGSVFAPAREAITKAGDSMKHVDVALKILKAGHYSINNLIIHHEQSILDDHFLGVNPPHVGTRALAQRYKYDLPLEFVNKEIFYYMAAGRTYRSHAHHAADIVNNNI